MLLVGQKNNRTVPAAMLHVVGHSSSTDSVRVEMKVEYDTGGVIVVGIVMGIVVGTVTVIIFVVGTTVG